MLPRNLHRYAAGVDTTIWMVHWVMLLLFLGWSIYFVYCLFRFRASNPAPRSPLRWKRLPVGIEVAIVLAEVGFFLFLSIPTWNRLKASAPSHAFQVRVVAEQYAWNIHYPGADGVFGRRDPKLMDGTNPVGLDRTDPAAQDDLVVINSLHVPLDRPTVVTLTSKDVIHNFYIPVMRIKQDVIPGMASQVWFDPTEAGEFDIACAQLCGLGHYRMRGQLTVEPAESFKKWYEEERKASLGS